MQHTQQLYVTGQKLKKSDEQLSHIKRKDRKPPWHIRLENKIQKLRVYIGRMTQYIKGNRGYRLVTHIADIKEKYKIHSRHENPNVTDDEFLDSLNKT